MKNSQKGFVVPLLLAIIAVLVIGGGVYIYNLKQAKAPTGQVEQPISVSDWKNYSDAYLSFDYSPLISVKKAGETISLSHSIAYKHPDPCDFIGDAPQLQKLSDFDVSIKIVDQNLKDFVQSSDYPGWNYVSANPYKLGSWSGYKIMNGIERCGSVVYYLTISPTRTLIIDSAIITEFEPIIGDHQTYLSLPGIITPNQAGDVLSRILTSLKIKQQAITQVPVKSTITVLSPNGGEMWQEGGTYQIKWTSKNVQLDAPGYIALTKDGTIIKVIGPTALNGGSMSNFGGSTLWTIPPEFVSEASPGKFKILIASSDNTIMDYSDSQFTIFASAGSQPIPAHPSINVLYPNGNEVLNNGGRNNIATIKWNSSGLGNSNVQIVATNKSNGGFRIIVSNVPNTGSYDWKMDPDITSGQYKINVLSTQDGISASDSSDDYFVVNTRSIVPGQTFVTLVSPNGGEKLRTGDKITIKWSSIGEKPTSATIKLLSNARCPYGYSCTPNPNSFADIAKITGSALDKGEYEWTVSKSTVISPNNEYLIFVLIEKDNFGNASGDDSDYGFTIN